jgi:tetratricopeptide (TPR) repeat protein
MGFPERRDNGGPPLAARHSNRLDTWKEIAAHLNRSVRTVQRWEREEGLPVHRHHHDKQGSIYAFVAELDDWWVKRGAHLDGIARSAPEAAAIAPEQTAAARRRPKAIAIGSLAAVAGVLIVFVAMTRGRSGAAEKAVTSAVPTETHHCRFLVADFDNLTSDPELSARIQYGLEQQLATSRYGDIVSRDQIEEVLRLMRLRADTPITARVGREICLRDGGIDALVTGQLEKHEAGYALNVRIIAPETGAVVASFHADAEAPGQLIEAERDDIVRRRSTVIDRLKHTERRPEVERVTSVSLAAVQLYAEAMALMHQVPMKNDPAFTLLSRAIKEDPEFASAYISAAWTLRNQRRPKSAYMPYVERALKFIDGTREIERYFILGSYYEMNHDLEKAASAFEALLEFQPDHYWALGNLARIYQALGRPARASELRSRQVDVRPRHFWAVFNLAEAQLLEGNLRGAREQVMHASSIAAQHDAVELQERAAWLQTFPACEAWLKDDLPAAIRLARELEQSLGNRTRAERAGLTVGLGYFYLTLGQMRSAERIFERLPREERFYHLAIVASQAGRPNRVAEHLADAPDAANSSLLTLGLPRFDAHLLPHVAQLVAAWDRGAEEADIKLRRGQLALMNGRLDAALALLASSIHLRDDPMSPPALAAREAIAEAWRRKGDVQQAIATLEEASASRFRSCQWPNVSGHLWVRLRASLAPLYRQAGRDAEGQAIDGELRKLLQAADVDHPLLAERSLVSEGNSR